MDSKSGAGESANASGSGSARGRCRGGKFSKGNSRRMNFNSPRITGFKQFDAESEFSRALLCITNTNFKERLMLICSFFSSVDITTPRNVDLKEVVKNSESILKKNDLNFEASTWCMNFSQNKRITGYTISAENKLDERYENLNFQICPGDGVLVDNLKKWFSIEHHEMTILKCLSEVIGILKSGEKFYIFNPHDNSLTVNRHATCALTEWKDIAQLADVLQKCLEAKGILSIAEVYELFCVNVITLTSNPPLNQRRSKAEEALKKIKEINTQDQEVDTDQKRKKDQEYHSKRRHEMTEVAKEEERKKAREEIYKKRIGMTDKERADELKKNQEYLAKRRHEMSEDEKAEEQKKNQEYLAKRRHEMSEDEKAEEQKKHQEYLAKRRHEMSEDEKAEEHKKNQEYLAKRRHEMSEDEKAEEQKKHQEYLAKRRHEMSEDEKAEEQKKNQEYLAKRRHEMSEDEKAEEQKKHQEYLAKRRHEMSEDEKAEEQKKHQEYLAKRRHEMSEDEKAEERNNHREYLAKRRLEMTSDEKAAEQKQQRENAKRRRIEMTVEEREAEKLKSKQRIRKNQEYYNDRNKLNASILKQFKLKDKKEVLVEKVATGLGGKAESNVEAERLINVALRYRQQLVNGLSSKLVSFVYTLKKCKGKSDEKEDIGEKFVAMMGSSLHSSNTESYFVDSTYTPMGNEKVYCLNEKGDLMDLFEPFTNKLEETLFSKWHCNEMCNIDHEPMYNRFMYLIDETLTSNEVELIELIENIDYCVRRSNLNRIISDSKIPNELLSQQEGCPCDICYDNRDLRTIWEKLKYPKEKPIYVDCTDRHAFVEDGCDCDGCRREGSSWQKLGHPHACYIKSSNNQGCSSMLRFLRTLAPHFPSIRNIVDTIYKITKRLSKLRELDTQIEGPFKECIEYLRFISDLVTEKAGANFVSSVEWPYAHENNIYAKYYAAFVVLKQKSLDLPNIVCFSCEKLQFKENVTLIPDNYRPKDRAVANMWEELLDHHENEGNDYQFICNYCYDKFKAGQFPPTCIFNNLQVKEPPQCITRLNDYEKMFIQRAKAFQVVTRMGAISGKNRPRKEMIQKLKGRTFHLPLPTEKTLEKLPTPEQAIIPNQEFYILVRGQPTKQKQVWQSFVNINHIYDALMWLKENNVLYKDIRLPSDSAENLLDELDDVDVQFHLEEKHAVKLDKI